MSELNEIKNQISKEIGYDSFDEYISELFTPNSDYSIERLHILIDQISERVQAKQQIVISQNAKVYHSQNFNSIRVDKKSIINNSNIIK